MIFSLSSAWLYHNLVLLSSSYASEPYVILMEVLPFQSGLEKNIFGSHLVPLPDVENRPPPPPFASDPLVSVADDRSKNNSNPYSSVSNTSLSSSFPRDEKFPNDMYISTAGTSALKIPEQDIIEIDGSGSVGNQLMSDHDPSIMKSSSPVGVSNA